MTITQSSTRLVAVAAGVAVALALLLGTSMPVRAAALSQTQIQSILNLLTSFGADQATLNNVSGALNGKATTGTTVTTGTTMTGGVCPFTWSRNLTTGSKGADVMALQKFLNMSSVTMVSTTGAGSPGMETSHFGGLTKKAVMKFQIANGISAVGNVGPMTRAKLNSLCTTTTTTTTTSTTTTSTTGGSATVSAATQPANTLAPANAARVPFTAFTVTAGAVAVVMNNVTVMRQGPSLDTDFAGVVLIDAATGVQVGNSRVLDSNHSATIGSAVTIPAGMSKTFWVAGNIAAVPGAGDIASFAVTAVNTNATLSGSLPIMGASNTMNATLTIGTATIQSSSFDPNSISSQPIGTTAYRFSGVRIQAGSAEDETFKSITWYQAGSASGLQNVMVVVAGTSYPTTLDVTGRYYTAVFPVGIVIAKGQSVDAYVSGDLGSNTTASTVAEFDIYRNTDIYLTGNTYGFGITPAIGSFGTVSTAGTHASAFAATNTGNPFFQGSTVSVTAGTFSTIQNATSVGAQNIAVNVSNQVLGGFQTNLTGEAITVQSLRVNFLTGAAMAVMTNVSLVNENGNVVAGPFDATLDTGISQHVTFTGSILFPTGSHTYTVKGQIPSSATNNTTVQASTSPATQWSNVTGNTTGNNITIGVTSFTMNTMTVKAATLSVGNSTSPTSQTVVAGGANVLFANIQLDASQSGEDVRLSSVPVTITVTGGAAAANLSNCQIWDGTTALNTGSRVINSANITAGTPLTATFSFDNSLTVAKGVIKTLGVTCNVASGATGTFQFASAAAGLYSVTGSVSGTAVTVPTVTGTAPTMTISSGATLAVSTDSSSPSYALVAGGTTGVTSDVIKFRAANEAVNLQKVGIVLTNGAASSSPADLTTVYLYAGNNIMTTTGTSIAAGTLLGTATFIGNGTSATSTLTTTIQLPKDMDATIVVKADYADIGSNQPGNEGHLVAIDYLNSQGVGNNSGATVYGTSGVVAGSAGLRTFNSIPTVALDATLPGTGVADGRLMQFKVTADSRGQIGLDKFTFTLVPTSATVTNVMLNVYTDATYSTLVSGTFGAAVGQFGSTASAPTSGVAFPISASTTALQVPAGSTYYFKLTGSIAGVTTGSSVVTTLNGDSAYPSLATAMGTVSGVASSKFIWSPNATTTANITSDLDWTNGFGVIGFPASGPIQTRSN